ncbi:isochorismatase family protein [Aquabacterium sp. A7-Y]|uniref:isochorismatase family protein n=1 Tax=Aquabacterium sp. A7-Y TaxID=1349605 RepID=UPI00223DE414|nr:isochorismatase family protein [Aquabacterium sp. A7-Y]MCW7539440.1 isochorismatase family protein [Aquabacterium sp. A7-Y]
MSIPTIAAYSLPADDSLPRNRVDWIPDPARAVLLIHDLQEYFLDFYGPREEPIPTLLANARRLRDAADAAGVPVVYTAQPFEQSPKDRGLLQSFWGPGLTAKPHRHPIVASLAPREQDIVLVKWRYSAFARTDLLQRMRQMGRDQLVICGVYAHIGCMISAADAFMNDIQSFMVADAVADFNAERHAMALDYVAQRCGVVCTVREVVEVLAPRTPQNAGAASVSVEVLRHQVAEVLGSAPEEVDPAVSLLEQGMDSIRLMTLVERFRAAGHSVGFVELAEAPTLLQWAERLQAEGRV